MNIEFSVEDYLDIKAELMSIYPEHWDELAFDKDIIPLAPDYDRYDAMARDGWVHVVVARNDRKEMVGYFIFFVGPALHYKSSLTAFYDIFYLRKPYRVGRNGIEFVKFAEKSLQEIGVQKVYTGVKLPHDFGAVFEYLGYRPTERIYTKIIG